MIMSRAEALKLRSAIKAALKSFQPDPAVDFHVNVATHSDILWKNWNFMRKQFDSDRYAIVDVRMYLKSQAGIIGHSTVAVLPDAKRMAELIQEVCAEHTKLKAEFVPVEASARAFHTNDEYMHAKCGAYDVRYYTNESIMWGRPNIIVTLPFTV